MDKAALCAEGYRFGNKNDLEHAELEKKKVEYFRAKLNHQNVRGMLAAYDKILDDKIFVTPVGWEFLKELQTELASAGVPLEQLRPIPMYVTFAHDVEEREPVRQKIHTSRKTDTTKRRLHISLGINIVLAILVILMFMITLKSDNPNILNYEKALVNKYASWEQELTQREKELKQKEIELERLE